jgi:hypothetical protein
MDPALLRKAYVLELPDPVLRTYYSRGARRRAAALQRFLRALHDAASSHLAIAPGLALLVVNRRDWHLLFSYPYGLPFTRNRGAVSHVIAAADYPNRLLQRFDAVALRAASAGAKPPGEVREFLDLLVGHEWGHAAANLSGLRSRVKWLDELLATYLFLAALDGAGMHAAYARFKAWARVGVYGSGVKGIPLGSFEYPRGRLKFESFLWFQGVFTLRAAELYEARGWAFASEFKAAMTNANRGDMARALIEAEPSFKGWFRVFADAAA